MSFTFVSFVAVRSMSRSKTRANHKRLIYIADCSQGNLATFVNLVNLVNVSSLVGFFGLQRSATSCFYLGDVCQYSASRWFLKCLPRNHQKEDS